MLKLRKEGGRRRKKEGEGGRRIEFLFHIMMQS